MTNLLLGFMKATVEEYTDYSTFSIGELLDIYFIVKHELKDNITLSSKLSEYEIALNKTLPLSTKDKYLNAWYCKHRIIRFNCSRTLAPLSLYRLLHEKFNLKELTLLVKKNL